MNVLFPSEIDVSSLKYSEMRPYGGQAKIIFVSHDDKPVVLQTPAMKCPYGLGRFDDGERSKYSLDLSFGGNTKSVEKLKDVLEKIDDKVLNDSTKNSLAWFKKKSQSRDVSQALYSSSVKVATENGEPTDKYPPTMKVKVPHYDNEFRVQVYDDAKERLSSDLNTVITKGQMVRAIVKLVGIWFAGGKFGITWELCQLKTTPRTQITGYAFEDEDEDNEENNEVMDDVEGGVPSGGGEYVLDSEDDL